MFNAAQVDNDPAATVPPVVLDPLDRDARAEAFFAAVPAVVAGAPATRATGPIPDDVVMPAFDAFHTAADAYCATDGPRTHPLDRAPHPTRPHLRQALR